MIDQLRRRRAGNSRRPYPTCRAARPGGRRPSRIREPGRPRCARPHGRCAAAPPAPRWRAQAGSSASPGRRRRRRRRTRAVPRPARERSGVCFADVLRVGPVVHHGAPHSSGPSTVRSFSSVSVNSAAGWDPATMPTPPMRWRFVPAPGPSARLPQTPRHRSTAGIRRARRTSRDRPSRSRPASAGPPRAGRRRRPASDAGGLRGRAATPASPCACAHESRCTGAARCASGSTGSLATSTSSQQPSSALLRWLATIACSAPFLRLSHSAAPSACRRREMRRAARFLPAPRSTLCRPRRGPAAPGSRPGTPFRLRRPRTACRRDIARAARRPRRPHRSASLP